MNRGLLLNREMTIASLTCAKCGKLSSPFPCEHCGSTEFVKHQTRRIIKPQPSWFGYSADMQKVAERNGVIGGWKAGGITKERLARHGKLGTVGDGLYVKEPINIGFGGMIGGEIWPETQFRYIWVPEEKSRMVKVAYDYNQSYRPARWMKKWAARIFFKITAVGCERVRAITEDDVALEGVKKDMREAGGSLKGWYLDPVTTFKALWQSCYPGSWERNDYVFKYTIERCGKVD